MKKGLSDKVNVYIEKFKSASPVAKASFALIIANFFNRGLALISGPIFTRIMPSAEYGIISTFTSWQSVFLIITTLNMSSGVFNNGMLDFKEDRTTFMFSILCLANLCTFFWLGIYLIFYHWINPFINMPNILMLIMTLYFIFTPSYNYWLGKQRFEFRYKAVMLLVMGSALISTAISIVSVILAPDNMKAVAKIISAEMVSVGIGFICYIYLMIRSKCKVKVFYWKYALTFNLPLIPHYLSMYILSSSDRIMITKLINTSATAVYNVASTVASVLLILWNSVDGAYAPWIYQKMEEQDRLAIKIRGNQIILVFACFSILVTVFAPEIMWILAPAEYYNGIYIIPAVSAGVFFTAVFTLFMRIELYLKRTKRVMLATFAVASLNVLLNYFLIPIYGSYAAGYTTMICYIVLAVFHYLNILFLGYGDTYDFFKILKISLLVLGNILVASILYRYYFIRYLVIVIIAILIIYNRNKIMGLIKKIF